LGLEGTVPDHSTFSKNRHGRFRESALFRRVFEEVVARCIRAGLVGGEGFAIDASVIEADASRGRKVDGKLTAWPEREKLTRPVREYLAALGRTAAVEAAETAVPDDGMPPGNPSAAPKVTSLTDPTAAWTKQRADEGRLRLRHQRISIIEIAPLGNAYSAPSPEFFNGIQDFRTATE
jgi:Transposase domain (DUF772)